MNSEPRLRCRVKDLVASCFNTCRLPLEEEEAGISGSKAQPETETPGKISVGEATMKTPDSKKRSAKSEAEPRFAEEDYIVFCFGEDGEIHMIEDSDTKNSSQILQPCINTAKVKNEEVEEANGSKMESSFESCDSSLSDTSTTSFAFPVLGLEWIGSPLHMPTPADTAVDSHHS